MRKHTIPLMAATIAFAMMGSAADAQSLKQAPPVAGSGCAALSRSWESLKTSRDVEAIQRFATSAPTTCNSYAEAARARVALLDRENKKAAEDAAVAKARQDEWDRKQRADAAERDRRNAEAAAKLAEREAEAAANRQQVERNVSATGVLGSYRLGASNKCKLVLWIPTADEVRGLTGAAYLFVHDGDLLWDNERYVMHEDRGDHYFKINGTGASEVTGTNIAGGRAVTFRRTKEGVEVLDGGTSVGKYKRC